MGRGLCSSFSFPGPHPGPPGAKVPEALGTAPSFLGVGLRVGFEQGVPDLEGVKGRLAVGSAGAGWLGGSSVAPGKALPL